jgi:tellurite resistance protein TerC
VQLFPFNEFLWLYGAFTLLVLGLLALDLGVFHRVAHRVSFREASTWTAVWIAMSLAINWALYAYTAATHSEEIGRQIGLEFLTGYLVEKALSIDNIFVFVLVFNFFGIPEHLQHRVLFYGIAGALIFRAIFIALGSVLLQFHWAILVFGGLLIVSGIKMILTSEHAVDPGKNPLLRLFRRVIPVTDSLEGSRFFVRRGSVILGTPLLVALIFIELSDIVFALDSVPAIFAITNEPFVVFTSNICAILGLRSLYFMLAGAVHRFWALKYGLATVLIFVGLKMVYLNDVFGGKFPIVASLAIIGTLIGASIAASLLFPRTTDQARVTA